MAVLAACGVPPSLASDKAEGTAQREAWRRFGISMQSVALTVSQELSAKLDAPGLSLSLNRMFAADLAGRSRAVGILTKAGLPLEKALALAGMEG